MSGNTERVPSAAHNTFSLRPAFWHFKQATIQPLDGLDGFAAVTSPNNTRPLPCQRATRITRLRHRLHTEITR